MMLAEHPGPLLRQILLPNAGFPAISQQAFHVATTLHDNPLHEALPLTSNKHSFHSPEGHPESVQP